MCIVHVHTVLLYFINTRRLKKNEILIHGKSCTIVTKITKSLFDRFVAYCTSRYNTVHICLRNTDLKKRRQSKSALFVVSRHFFFYASFVRSNSPACVVAVNAEISIYYSFSLWLEHPNSLAIYIELT